MKSLAMIGLVVAFLFAPVLALAAPGDDCSFLPDPAEQVKCRAAAEDPAQGKLFGKCAEKMVRGLCERIADPFVGCASLPEPRKASCRHAIESQTELFSLADGRQVNVPMSAVFAVRGLQTADPNDLTMCHTAVRFCREQPASLECLVGRSSWGTTRDWGR